MVKRIIERLEGAKYSPFHGFLTLAIIIVARGVLEGALEMRRNLAVQADPLQSIMFIFLHQFFFFVAVFLSLVLFLSLFARERPGRVARAVLPFFSVIITPPLVDALFFGGGLRLSYVPDFAHLTRSLFGVFMIWADTPGITPGMKIEGYFMYVLVFIYVFTKTRHFLRSIGAVITTYLFILIVLGSFPALISHFSGLPNQVIFKGGGLLLMDTQKYALINLFYTTVLGALILAMWRPRLAKRVLSGLRPEKAPFYLAMGYLGAWVGWVLCREAYPALFKNPFDYLALVGLGISIYLAFIAGVLYNDYSELEIDRLNQKPTPLAEGLLSRDEALSLAHGLALLSLAYALALGYPSFLVATLMIGAAVIYSLPPLRLKRFLMVSTLNLGAVAALAMIYGVSLFAKEKAFGVAPPELVAAVVLGVALAFVVKDRTDIQGDRAYGVTTFFTLLPYRRAQVITSLMAASVFIVLPLVLGVPMALLWGVPAAAAMFALGMAKRYMEPAMWLVFFLWGGATYFPYSKKLEGRKTPEVAEFTRAMAGEQFYRLRVWQRVVGQLGPLWDRGKLSSPRQYATLARSLANLKKFQEASRAYSEGVKKFPLAARLRLLSLSHFYSTMEYDTLARVMREAEGLGIFSPEIPKFQGLLAVIRGDTPKALALFQRMALWGEPAGLFLTYMTLREAGRGGYRFREKALRMHADPDKAYPYFAYILYKRGDLRTAALYARELLRLKPNTKFRREMEIIVSKARKAKG